MIFKKSFYIHLFFAALLATSSVFASGQFATAGQAEPRNGVNHQRKELTIARLTPMNSHHKNTITLSNGVKYKVYPFHGWDLDHWAVGQSIKIEKSQDLLYKIKIRNLSTDDSISVKRKPSLQ
ncbi:MAG: hypothetical protein K940chlam3_01672 [Chlamydiae bacterium]|nr:hypothetical protein [Chlamydiota bacterium]